MAANTVTPVKMQTADFETNQLQSNLITAITALSNQVVNSPANGYFIIDQVLKSGDNVVQHKLGVVPVGYIVISQNGVSNLYLVAKNQTTLTLNSSAPVTASIFTF